MKKILVTLAGLALAGAALAASVDPTRPMVTGRGNVSAKPVQVIVTNQTAAAPADSSAQDTMQLDKFVVTGSLIHKTVTVSKSK
jgi:hypothetical protein